MERRANVCDLLINLRCGFSLWPILTPLHESPGYKLLGRNTVAHLGGIKIIFCAIVENFVIQGPNRVCISSTIASDPQYVGGGRP